MVKHWSKLQSGVALSSAEAELYACNRAATELLGLRQLCQDLGEQKSAQCMIDASACKSMLSRTGVGKSKHIEIGELWLQEKVERGAIAIHKVGRAHNCSDAFTHYWSPKDAATHFNDMGLEMGPREV